MCGISPKSFNMIYLVFMLYLCIYRERVYILGAYGFQKLSEAPTNKPCQLAKHVKPPALAPPAPKQDPRALGLLAVLG
jgi:hypothetical protein